MSKDLKDYLNPEAEAEFEAAMRFCETSKDLAGAKARAVKALELLQWPEKREQFIRDISKALSPTKILFILYSIKLAGEGLKVIK